MPQLSRSQLIEFSRGPGTIFFAWHEAPAERYYHMMISPGGSYITVRAGWELHESYALGPMEITRRIRRLMLRDSWVSVTRERFVAVMEGRDGAFHGKSDPRLKTNHKLGAPKGKLP